MYIKNLYQSIGTAGKEEIVVDMEVLKAKVSEKGLNFSTLERKANVGNGVIAKWDHATPKLDTLQRVAKVLECPVDDLIIKEAV